MNRIINAIEEWVKDLLVPLIEANLINMFFDINDKVGTIATEVGHTPHSWNVNIFNMIRNLSETVILPIAGIIITYVLCVELISMVMDKNSFHDNVDTFMFFKFFFKAWVAVFLVAHTFDITMAIFDVAHWVVTRSRGVISGGTNINLIGGAVNDMNLRDYSVGELLGLLIDTMIVSIGMKIMSIIITVIIYGRMIKIYLTCSVAPIPFATMTNREWGQIGNNYLKGLFALGFQGFLIIVCVAIYAVLLSGMIVNTDVNDAIWSLTAYTVLLCFALIGSGRLANSVFNAH